MVAPVNIESADPGTTATALFILTLGFQTEMVPSNDAKMKTPELPAPVSPGGMIKSVSFPLKTIPVGLPAIVWDECGMVTINPCFVPEPSYSVETPDALSETHQGPPVALAIPQIGR